MMKLRLPGRGVPDNPPNRFERISRFPDPGEEPEARLTEFLPDKTLSVVSSNQSPDVPFDVSVNPYRGCEHGCVYCYARPTHEYLGLSAGLDFEKTILVKHRAPELLRAALGTPSWKPKLLGMSGVTDPYQPAERRFGLTRGCLEVLRDFRNPVSIVTKNHLVTRDLDLLSELADHGCVHVTMSVTSLDPDLQRRMEPRTSVPAKRLRAIEALADAGIPVGVNLAPVIPGLNDEEIPAILEAARNAGASYAAFLLLRLPLGVSQLFEALVGPTLPRPEGPGVEPNPERPPGIAERLGVLPPFERRGPLCGGDREPVPGRRQEDGPGPASPSSIDSELPTGRGGPGGPVRLAGLRSPSRAASPRPGEGPARRRSRTPDSGSSRPGRRGKTLAGP